MAKNIISKNPLKSYRKSSNKHPLRISFMLNVYTHDLPPQDTTHARSPYNACHNSYTNWTNE
jgi:hypothetical protein